MITITKSPARIPFDSWSHVVGTFDGATIRLYINGSLVNLAAYEAQISHSSTPLSIGGASVGSWYPWDGSIDEVAVYDKALSSEQIAKHCHRGAEGPDRFSLPDAMSVNAATGLLEWTPKEDQVGIHEVAIQVSDGPVAGRRHSRLPSRLRLNIRPQQWI